MKRTKKLFSLALTLVMTLAMAVPSFAAEGDKTITVSNAVNGQTYTAYQVFGVTNSGDNYAYTIDSSSAFYNTVTAYAAANVGTSFVLNQVGTSTTYVVVPDMEDDGVTAKLDAAAFAAALNADTTKGNAAGSAEAADGTASITVTSAGYYFVDSNLGSLCALDTAVNSVTVYEKNSKPTLNKSVKENGNFGATATADIDDVVEFKLTVGVGNEYAADLGTGVDKDYVIYDTLPAGMTYVPDDNNAETTEDGVSIDGWTLDTDYSVAYNKDTKLLTITLESTKLDDLASAATFDIIYFATLDDNAVVAGNGNKNEARLVYGEYETPVVDAVVYTWKTNFLKYTGEAKTPLADAKFTLNKSADGSNPLTFTQVGTTTTYKYDAQGTITEITTTATGAFEIEGLDAGTYYLTEIEAPDGYNKLTAPVKFKITNEGAVQVYDTEKSEYVTVTGTAGIEVENKTGVELPSTGGMGTTIFYAVGGVMMAGAAILLVTKKKMANEE